ncbi:MAG: GNAT family N-acetyltransferase [Acutalibacteraceae bacterium]
MNTPTLETERLLLRRFTEADIDALYALLRDEEVNTFLPWFPPKCVEDARRFYESGTRPSTPVPGATRTPYA